MFGIGGFCSHAYKTWLVQQFGAVGAVLGETSFITPSWDALAQDQEVAPQLTIPLNIVGRGPLNFMLQQAALPNNTLTVTLSYQQDNFFWFSQQPAFVFIQTFFCIWFGICATIALWKWWLFVREQEGISISSVPQWCMI